MGEGQSPDLLGEIGQRVRLRGLFFVFDQARQSIAASEAHATVVVGEVNIPPVRGDGISGPIIQSLLPDGDLADHSLRISCPVLENDCLH